MTVLYCASDLPTIIDTVRPTNSFFLVQVVNGNSHSLRRVRYALVQDRGVIFPCRVLFPADLHLRPPPGKTLTIPPPGKTPTIPLPGKTPTIPPPGKTPTIPPLQY